MDKYIIKLYNQNIKKMIIMKFENYFDAKSMKQKIS